MTDRLPLNAPAVTVTTEGGRQTCDECGATFPDRRGVSRHIRGLHRGLPAFGPAAEALRGLAS